MAYRVVYGETMPAWERIFPPRRAADRFKRQREHVGDVVFSVAKVIEGEPPQSIMAALGEQEIETKTFAPVGAK